MFTSSDAVALEALVDASICCDNNEAVANKLLAFFGSAEQAVRLLDNQRSEKLGINPQLVKVFSAVRKFNISTVFRRLSVSSYPLCKSTVSEFFDECFPFRKTYVVQFFFFCGSKFVGASEPITGTINYVNILSRSVFSEALANNASTILPVVGLPEGMTSVSEEVKDQLDHLANAGAALEITTDYTIVL